MAQAWQRCGPIVAAALLAVAGCGGSNKSATGTQPSNAVPLTLGSVVSGRLNASESRDYSVRLAPGALAIASLIVSTGAATFAVSDANGAAIGGSSGCGTGASVHACTVTGPAGDGGAFLRVAAGVRPSRYAVVVASIPAAEVATGVTKASAGSLIAGAVETRSRTSYLAQGLLPGSTALVALFGQDGAADLRLYQDSTRSLQYPCTLNQQTTLAMPESCLVPVSLDGTIWFDVAAGPLERANPRFYLYVWPGAGPFTVTTTTPPAGMGSAPDSPITLRFSDVVDPTSVSSATVVLRAAGAAAPASLQVRDNTVVVTPAARLPASSPISVQVDGVMAASGDALDAPFRLDFVTFANPDFSVTPVPATESIAQSGTAGAELIFQQTAGQVERVALAISGCPPGAQCTVSPDSAFRYPFQWNDAPFAESVALRVVTSGTTPPGGYNVRVHAVGSVSSHDASFALTVTSPPAAGNPRVVWGEDGIGIAVAPGHQLRTVSANDGIGGLLAVWEDDRTGSGYPQLAVQRLGPDGVPVWWGQGVAVTSFANGGEGSAAMFPDGTGGLLVAFNVWNPDNGQQDVFAQRLGADGSQLWGPRGVAVSTACWQVGCANQKRYVQIAPDGVGGAFIAWEELRDGFHFSIWAQRVDKDGKPLWTRDGIPVRDGPYDRMQPRMVADGQGGAIVIWRDFEVGFAAQRLDASGSLSWGATGVTLGGSIGENVIDYPGYDLIADGSGGALIAWIDNRNSATSDADVFATRVTAAGGLPWGASGVPVCTRTRAQYHARLTADGAGGMFVVWEDQGVSSSGAQLVFAQRLDGSGVPQWLSDGVPVNADHSSYPLVWPAGNGGAFVTWDGLAGIGKPAIGAQRLDATGKRLWGDGGFFIVPPGVNYGYGPASVPDGSGGLFIHWQDYRLPAPWPWDVYVTRLRDR